MASLEEVEAEIARRARLREVEAEIARRKQAQAEGPTFREPEAQPYPDVLPVGTAAEQARQKVEEGAFKAFDEAFEKYERELAFDAALGVGVAAGIGTLGWLIARRTLLASRPRLTHRWLGVFGPTVWKCARCGTEVALRTDRCGACGQYQTWPKWSVKS